MTYQAISDMAGSASLMSRIVAAAAGEGSLSPQTWVGDHIWEIVSHDAEWEARWSDSVFNYNPTYNPDTGARPDVITDEIILPVVQAIMAAPPSGSS